MELAFRRPRLRSLGAINAVSRHTSGIENVTLSVAMSPLFVAEN